MTPPGSALARRCGLAIFLLSAIALTAAEIVVWRDNPDRPLPIDQPDLRIDAVFPDRFRAFAKPAGLELLRANQWRFSEVATPRAANGYPDHATINAQLEAIVANFPDRCRTYKIGESRNGRDLIVIRLTDNPAQHEPEEPRVKIVAAMHGDEKISAAIALQLVEYLLARDQPGSRIAACSTASISTSCPS